MRIALVSLALWGAPIAGLAADAGADKERANFFGDPFMQITSAIAHGPPQFPPQITRAKMRA
jgi:hypothetical protein